MASGLNKRPLNGWITVWIQFWGLSGVHIYIHMHTRRHTYKCCKKLFYWGQSSNVLLKYDIHIVLFYKPVPFTLTHTHTLYNITILPFTDVIMSYT